MIPASDWRWYGSHGHFICGRWCRYHLATEIGSYLVSTVGQYVHPRHTAGSEQAEADWLQEHPHGEEIGAGRYYETMVFRVIGHCDRPDCGCGLPVCDYGELDCRGYTTPAAATAGHMELCALWAAHE